MDDFHAINHAGWSVAVTGVANGVSNRELDEVRHEPVARWAPSGDEAMLAISTELVSGRRMTTASHAFRR